MTDIVRINQIQITNHFRIADLEVAVRRHAVIIGANDVGKTSILRLLHLLLGSTIGQVYQQLTREDLADPTSELVVEVRFVEFTDEERRLFPFEIRVGPDDRDESLRVRLTVEIDPADDEAVTVRRWFPDAGHDRAPTREQLLAFGWRYLPATRSSAAASLDGPNSALQTLLRAIDLGDEKSTLIELLNSFNASLDTSQSIVDLRERVATHLSKAMPHVIAADDLSVRTASDPGEEVLGAVTMFFERAGKYVPLVEQSDGLRQLMSMTLFDLAEGAANVVAIDEPELHLHPSSQRTVAELFSSTNNQKILVTHSPYIVHRFDPSEVIAVSPDSACHQIAASRLTVVEKERSNWWSPRLLEVLTARYAIMVEGVSDRIVVEAAARVLGIGLDRLGAVVFELDGASKFPNVYKLIGPQGFHVPVIGLVDENEKGIWLGAIGGRPKHVLGQKLWVSSPDLEGEYCQALTGPGAARMLVNAGFCKEDAILQTTEADSIDDVNSEKLAAYCRKGGNKVSAATAIASQLTAEAAAKIASVAGLLNALQSADVS